MSKLICAVVLFCLGSCLSAQTVSLKLFVGTMGRSDEAERFRLLLGEEAEKAGFIGVDRPEAADLILTGALIVRVYADYSQAQATVQLKAPGGERIWGRDFPPHHGRSGEIP